MSFAIECQDLTKFYRRSGKKFAAVGGLNLQIAPRQVYGFLGPNGAGKTTTIRLFLDLIHPSSGEVRLFGEKIRRNPSALRQVGALVEGANFYPYLSAWDNLRILGWSGNNWDEQRARQLLNDVDLLDRAQDSVSKFSTGMKQRLGIAATLLHDPPLIILDEPTNGLDPSGIHAMRKYIRHLVDEQGKTVFISSHLLNEIQQICDRVAIIQHGKLLAENSVDQLLTQNQADELLIEVTPLEPAEALLKTTWTVTRHLELENTLVVKIPREDVPQVAKQLAQADLNIFGMRHKQISLEDFFLSITGESA